MSTAAEQVQRNLIDYVMTLDPNESVRELGCLLSALRGLGEQLKAGVDPAVTGSVLILLGGVAEGVLEQIATKPGGTPPAAKDPNAMCATQLMAAQLKTLGPGIVG